MVTRCLKQLMMAFTRSVEVQTTQRIQTVCYHLTVDAARREKVKSPSAEITKLHIRQLLKLIILIKT